MSKLLRWVNRGYEITRFPRGPALLPVRNLDHGPTRSPCTGEPHHPFLHPCLGHLLCGWWHCRLLSPTNTSLSWLLRHDLPRFSLLLTLRLQQVFLNPLHVSFRMQTFQNLFIFVSFVPSLAGTWEPPPPPVLITSLGSKSGLPALSASLCLKKGLVSFNPTCPQISPLNTLTPSACTHALGKYFLFQTTVFDFQQRLHTI